MMMTVATYPAVGTNQLKAGVVESSTQTLCRHRGTSTDVRPRRCRPVPGDLQRQAVVVRHRMSVSDTTETRDTSLSAHNDQRWATWENRHSSLVTLLIVSVLPLVLVFTPHRKYMHRSVSVCLCVCISQVGVLIKRLDGLN